jgi:hypothetical protein
MLLLQLLDLLLSFVVFGNLSVSQPAREIQEQRQLHDFGSIVYSFRRLIPIQATVVLVLIDTNL